MKRKIQYYVCPILIIGLLTIMYIIMDTTKQAALEVIENPEGDIGTSKVLSKIPSKKEESLWLKIKHLLGQNPIEGITVIDMIPTSMEVDPYNRCFATFQVLGVDETEEINLYDYYVVAHESKEGDLFVMPFGVEVIRSDKNTMKKDITTSILKVTNGWGMPVTDYQEKWTNKVKSSDEGKGNENLSSMMSIYNAQKVITFMTNYINEWLEAIKNQDPSLVVQYYEEGSPAKKIALENLEKMKEKEMAIEVWNLEMLDIICYENEGLYKITVQGKIQAYSEEKILSITQKMIYTIKENNDSFLIINQEVVKKE